MEKRRQKKEEQDEDLVDDDKPIFPNVADFDPADPTDDDVTPTAEDVEVEPETTPDPEPQIQIAPQHDDGVKELPKSHSLRKMIKS